MSGADKKIAKVYVWDSSVEGENPGHVRVEIGSFVSSVWPALLPSFGPLTIVPQPMSNSASLEDDCAIEQGRPDKVITVPLADPESAVRMGQHIEKNGAYQLIPGFSPLLSFYRALRPSSMAFLSADPFSGLPFDYEAKTLETSSEAAKRTIPVNCVTTARSILGAGGFQLPENQHIFAELPDEFAGNVASVPGATVFYFESTPDTDISRKDFDPEIKE